MPDRKLARRGASRSTRRASRRPACSRGTMAALYKCGGDRARRGPAATTSTSPSARATCRPRRCRSRSPTRRSPTTARSCAPHLGKAIEDGNGVTLQEFRPKPRRKIKIDRARPRTSCSTACGAPRSEEQGTSADVFKGWPMQELPGLRQDRHRRAPRRTPTRPGTPASSRTTARPIVVVVTVEKGGFGAATAAPAARMILSEWFDVSGPRVPRRDRAPPDERQPIQPASEPPPPLVPREWRLRLDPLLLLATLGLVACSLIAIKGATADDVDDDPLLLRQAPGDLRGRRARPDVRRLAAGLLAPARAAVPDLRRC